MHPLPPPTFKQGMGVHISPRPKNRHNVPRDPDVVQLHYKGIGEPRLHIHGTPRKARWCNSLEEVLVRIFDVSLAAK